MSAAPNSHPPMNRIAGVLIGTIVGGAIGLTLGVAYWAPAAYFLGLEEHFQQNALGGVIMAIVGLALYPFIGGMYWSVGGAAAGLLAGCGRDRRAGLTGAVFGMWVGGVLGGVTHPETYSSALAGVLVWAAYAAPIGAVAGLLLTRQLGPTATGAARGMILGMFLVGVGGIWLVTAVGIEARAAILGVWAGFPVVTGLVGAIAGSRRATAENHDTGPSDW